MDTKTMLRHVRETTARIRASKPKQFDVQTAADRFAALYGKRARQIPLDEVEAIQAMPDGLPKYYAAINAGEPKK